MKGSYFAFILLVFIACCGTTSSQEADKTGDGTNTSTGNPYDEIPTIPGDNSHYVEGKSRYIWFPDGQGKPILVDLKETINETTLQEIHRDGSKNEYWLYTRENPHKNQYLVYKDAKSIAISHYRASRPTKVIVHGWRSNGDSPINVAITSAFLIVEDCNVIVVDWRKIASGFNYPGAAAGVPSVGTYLGHFLVWLFDTAGGDWNTLHLAGHSLGAHVVGNAGRTAGGRPRRVTGMDPAGPLWNNNQNALDTRAGQYVEAIHTDGGVLGLWRTVGHADFYPNGGTNPQPGCWISICSHSRSYELFAATVQLNRLLAEECKDLKEAEEKKCIGRSFYMGNNNIDKFGRGIYGLSTGANWPF